MIEQELYEPQAPQEYPDEQEIDFLTGIAPSCNLEEGCESCQ